jgi:hypothetical protein
MKGPTDGELVQGTCSFNKVSINEATLNMENGWIFLVVSVRLSKHEQEQLHRGHAKARHRYESKKDEDCYAVEESKSASTIAANRIRPLILSNVVVLPKKGPVNHSAPPAPALATPTMTAQAQT